MRLAMIGLGRMGAGIARRLMEHGHEIVGYDRSTEAVEAIAKVGATAASSLEDVVAKMVAPRIFWVMLPAGEPTETTVEALMAAAEPGDIIIDGGNSFYKDDIRRAKAASERGVHYVDVGTSGGVWGLRRGFCMMIGGEKAAVDLLDPIFDSLSPGIDTVPRTPERIDREGCDPRAEKGYIHCGAAG